MMKVKFFVIYLFKRFMQLIHKLQLKLKVKILSKVKTIKLKEIEMRNLSIKEAIELAKEFEQCKTVEEQQKFCKNHELELEFQVQLNAQEGKKGDTADDNQGSTTKDK